MKDGRKSPPAPVTLEATKDPVAEGAYTVALDDAPAAPKPRYKRKRNPLILYIAPALLVAVTLSGVLALTAFGSFGTAFAPPSPRASSAAQDLAAEWRLIDRSDPAAIRKFIAARGALAGEAKATLSTLDALAWSKVQQQTHAEAQLSALDAYDLHFPDGERAADSQALRARIQDLVEEIESELAAQGFKPGLVDGVITGETSGAAQAYQSAMRVSVSGVIDRTLLGQLRATSASPTNSTGSRAEANANDAGASPAVGKAFRDCFVCPEMVALPVGKAMMGDMTGAGEDDEKPVREVSISYQLAVGKFEVTFEEWDACVADGGCAARPSDNGWGRGSRPAINVNWQDAQEYARWLTQKTGKQYRLLSEAEWEYAARAGSPANFTFGNDLAQLCAYANHADSASDYRWKNTTCSDGFSAQTAPAGSFRANAFGLFDMHGNVFEWVADCWHDAYDSAPNNGAAWTSNCDKSDRILRGGSWSAQAAYGRAAYRYSFDSKARTPFFGFRVAREM